MRKPPLIAALAVTIAVLLTTMVPSVATAAQSRVKFDPILEGYSLPVLVTHAGGDSRVIFIVEQTGRIKRATFRDGAWKPLGTFLDITGKVNDPTAPHRAEQGLLGLAFHPRYERNGRFYVHYTRAGAGADDSDVVIAEYRRATARRADVDSERVIMVIDKSHSNHNGGHLAFGPDRKLYVAVGDGGGHGDPDDNGQDLTTRLGKILRIDPLDPDGDGPERYSVPGDNPFVGLPGLDEIWAYGTRNPWRFSFDRQNGNLWIGDVGEETREEVDKARHRPGRGAGKGANYGWSVCEGDLEFKPVAGQPCTFGRRPLFDYVHRDGWCSVTGGYVHRGPRFPRWRGLYIAADWCGGLFVLDQRGDLRHSRLTPRRITSFGEDAAGRLFATGDGKVYEVKLLGPRA